MKKLPLIIMLFCLGEVCLAEMPVGPLEVGDVFPRFADVDIYGKEVDIEKLKGRVVVLSIASFDQAKKRTDGNSAEAKKLGDFYAANRPNGLEVIRISSKSNIPFFVTKSFVESRARKACKKDNDPWPVIIDWDGSFKVLLQMTDSPLTFIIDKDGIIKYKKSGFLTASDEVKELVGKLI
jgi:peroxiredoxin